MAWFPYGLSCPSLKQFELFILFFDLGNTRAVIVKDATKSVVSWGDLCLA